MDAEMAKEAMSAIVRAREGRDLEQDPVVLNNALKIALHALDLAAGGDYMLEGEDPWRTLNIAAEILEAQA